MKIKVKNSGVVKLQFFDDKKDGTMVIGESKKNIPFNIKRIYYINKLNNQKSVRGKHAHKKLEQVIFCINGFFRLNLDDGYKKQRIVLDNLYYGIRLGPMLWHEMTDFSKDCVILVLASDFYNKKDYIRSYDEFIERVKKKK